MTFKSAQSSRLLVGGLHASGYARGVSPGMTTDMLDVTTLLDTSKVFIPGQDSAEFDFDFLFDSVTSAGSAWATWNTWKGTPQVVSYAPEGLVIGSPAILSVANLTGLTRQSQIAAPVGVQVTAVGDGETGCCGFSQVDFTTSTISNNSASSATLDGAAATTAGGIVHVHVTAYSGYTSVTFKLRSSTDDNTFNDVTGGTTSAMTGTGAERVTVTSGTTINRYTRLQWTTVGSGSVTFQASLHRR